MCCIVMFWGLPHKLKILPQTPQKSVIPPLPGAAPPPPAGVRPRLPVPAARRPPLAAGCASGADAHLQSLSRSSRSCCRGRCAFFSETWHENAVLRRFGSLARPISPCDAAPFRSRGRGRRQSRRSERRLFAEGRAAPDGCCGELHFCAAIPGEMRPLLAARFSAAPSRARAGTCRTSDADGRLDGFSAPGGRIITLCGGHKTRLSQSYLSDLRFCRGRRAARLRGPRSALRMRQGFQLVGA